MAMLYCKHVMQSSCVQAIEPISAKQQLAMKQKRAMELAVAPGKNLMMNAFMMYMSGSSINIFRYDSLLLVK
jgi:Protein of unknown function (DUF1077)